MKQWIAVWVMLGVGSAAWGQDRLQDDRSRHTEDPPRTARSARKGQSEHSVRSEEDLREEAFGQRERTDRRHHRFAPFRDGWHEADGVPRSWNRYSANRSRRFRLRSECSYNTGVVEAYHNDGYRGGFGRDLGYDGYGGYGYSDTADHAEIYLNQSYYDDGPYGPGYYNRNSWYQWYVASHRAGQLFDARAWRLDDGLSLFRASRFERAAVALLGAARLDHTDAASRVHAGHALFAVGRYDEAVKLLARGFELAPRLATSAYDIRDDYGDTSKFDDHLKRLKTYVATHPRDADGVALLGYVLFYTQGPSAAYSALSRASHLRPKDMFIPKLLDISRSVRPLKIQKTRMSKHQSKA